MTVWTEACEKEVSLVMTENSSERLEKFRDLLLETSIFLEPPYFDDAVVGVLNGHVVYSYSKLASIMSKAEDAPYEECQEFIDFNTLRALPYMGPMAPLIVERLEDLDGVTPELSDFETLQLEGETWAVMG